MAADANPTPARIVVAGGGIAGLETLLALRDLAADRAAVTLVAPEMDFTYKPLAVDEPFTFMPPERRELAPVAAELGAEFVQQAVERVAPEDHRLGLADGTQLDYDIAVLCLGGRPRAAYRSAHTFWAPGEALDIEQVLRDAAASDSGRLVLLVPPGVTWSLPLYEVALMSRGRAQQLGLPDLEIVVVTPEPAPLSIFGPVASQAIAELLRVRGIEVRCDRWAEETDDGSLLLMPGHERLEAEQVIALPVITGPALEGVPATEGFIAIDEHARVRDCEDLYAAGDGTAFPIKQGGIATQQADAAAEHIAARLGAGIEPAAFHPVLRGKLFVGDESVNLKADLAGGGGEGVASPDYLWWPPHKVSGRYLAPWLAGELRGHTPEPSEHALDIEVALPREWHGTPLFPGSGDIGP
ncbi:MAG: NAD(P)/FAD-dependent oxidoreductase [Solirubrobacterales bacterium]